MHHKYLYIQTDSTVYYITVEICFEFSYSNDSNQASNSIWVTTTQA